MSRQIDEKAAADLGTEDMATVVTIEKFETEFTNYREFLYIPRENPDYERVYSVYGTGGFYWKTELTWHRSCDRNLMYASIEVKPSPYYTKRGYNVFDPEKYASYVKDYMLVGFLKVSLFSKEREFIIERESIITEPTPSERAAMPLRFEIKMIPVSCASGYFVFELQWGFIKKNQALNANPPVEQTRFNLSPYAANETFSDVVFNVKGTKLPAHKLILAAKSPVFEAAFTHQMKEKQTNFVVVNDIAPEVFRELLRFFYTDEVPTEVLKKHGASLLLAADKYDLPRLVYLCTPHAVNDQTSYEDILRLYVLASSQGSSPTSTLKKNIIRFIKAKGATFTKSAVFVKFMKDDSRTALEILTELM